MNYRALNKNQKDRMNAISSSSYVMEWENPDFMDYLMGKLPEIRRYQKDKEIEEIASLEKLLAKYDAFFSEKSVFLEEIKKILDILNFKKKWYGISFCEIRNYMGIHSFCLISGEGGIGKSYFIKCFEEQLEEKNIEHLCLYGKFEKNTNNINIEEIIKASDKGFVFVFDAINEMSEAGQNNLLDILTELKKYPKIRIIVTYRTNSMDSGIQKKYQEISEYEYKFPGVSFESALSEILRLSVPNVYMYEDILYSNNAFLLSRLCDILSSYKIESENGIASITFILEQYIKKTINVVFKDSLDCQGIDIWKDIKRIAQWMYENEKTYIDESSLLSVIKTGKNFLLFVMQMRFMEIYENSNEKHYYFNIDSLTDFLIARSLFEDISGRHYEEQISIIKSKVKSLNNLKEALIIAIFDNISPDYKKIKDLLKDTELFDHLNYNTLVKIHYKSDDIKVFQEMFKPNNHDSLLQSFGGYTDKPFNCSNYLFDYYCKSSEKLFDLTNILSGYHYQNEIKNRLKNVLYFTTLNDRNDKREDEAFYFALLCCAAPNRDIRCLAMKLLYEVISKNEVYVNRVILEYNRIFDFYIKEAVIYVLSQTKKDNSKIIDFYNKIIVEEDNLSAKSLRRISAYFGKPYSYINWDRKNLFKYKEDSSVSDYLSDILFKVDFMNKDYLPFQFWGKDNISIDRGFLTNNKDKITLINDYLHDNYSCVCGGKCSGLCSFENSIMSEIEKITKIKKMDINSFMESFEEVFRYVIEYYGTSLESIAMNICEEDFQHSFFMKCVDIAIGIYYGSLMCNYYTDHFVTYNSIQNIIGYEVYDPLEYGEDVLITAPIPIYQDIIERLGDYVINSLEMPEPRDGLWVRNVDLTRKNLLKLFQPVELKKQKWVMLAGRVSLHEENEYGTIWKDTYDLYCCSSENETIYDDGDARYLTIELEEYSGNLSLYSDNDLKPWLCKRVKNINYQSDVFEETSLVLPPSDIIKFFNLQLNISDLSWETQDKKKVIICNNNKNSYYRDPIGGTVFIQQDYLNKFLEENSLKFFAFTERFILETGYADETSLHFEIINGKIEKEIKNHGASGRCDDGNNSLCSVCVHANIIDVP